MPALTGAFCWRDLDRHLLPARLPRPPTKLENCRFFASAAQAEAQRFRPCMKCRPELAPA